MDTIKAPAAGTTAITAERPQVWHAHVEAGVRYRVLIESDSDSNGLDQDLWAGAWSVDGGGASDQHMAPTGTPIALSLQPDQDGSIELWLSLSGAAAAGRASYRLQVIEGPADDHADDGRLATPLALGRPATGMLDDGVDRDCFAFDLEAGQIVRFTAHSDSDVATASLPLALMNIWGGVHVASNDALEFTVPFSGRWVLRVGDGNSSPGAYAVASESAEPLPSQGGPAAGEAVIGRLGVAGQHQRLDLTLAADERVDVELSGLQGGMPSAWMVAAPNGDGLGPMQAEATLVRPGYDWEQQVSMLRVDGSQSQHWQIDVEAAAGPIDYRITARRVNSDDHGDQPAHATALAMGSSVEGRFESAADQDWFALTLPDEQPVEVVVAGTDAAAWSINWHAAAGWDPGTGMTWDEGDRLVRLHLPATAAKEFRFGIQGSGAIDYRLSVQAAVEPPARADDEATEPDALQFDPGYDDLGWLAVAPLGSAPGRPGTGNEPLSAPAQGVAATETSVTSLVEPILVGLAELTTACPP